MRVVVKPLAFETLGVRGMCTYVETPDVRVLIDAGASLGMRFGLLPHPREYRALMEARRLIREYAERCEVVTVSHYHYDHYTPAWRDRDYVWTWSCLEEAEAVYGGKVVLAKDVRGAINHSQRVRGWLFERSVRGFVGRLEVADGREFAFNRTIVRFSPPVPHGEEGSGLGWVLMTCIEHEGFRLVHTSDVQGQRPSMVIVGGPPTYLAEGRVSSASIARGLEGVARLAERLGAVVVDHHLARDEGWRVRVEGELRRRGVEARFMSAAELLGRGDMLLEARRRRLYEEEPPGEEFMRWARMRGDERRRAPPPV
ncbi:hypothetical protein B6U99_05825 [Candidatus Geothermarchaeota archaeon ex4572_27]|nr:MAG: hypothetical protein B6U99_05825 [Candidatus Geothermarchaeota archaeon ex4572_27]